jgi:hypothetical protein
MKYILFLFLMITICFDSEAQKTKSFDVVDTQFAHVFGLITYEGDIKKDTIYNAHGRDSRYSQYLQGDQPVMQYVPIHIGTLKEIYDFYHYCEDFMQKEEMGVSDYYQGNRLSVVKSKGMRSINISGINKDEKGYTTITGPQFHILYVAIEYFAKHHNILLK